MEQFTFYELYADILQGTDDVSAGKLASNICAYEFEDREPDGEMTDKAALQIRDLMKKNPDLIASAKSNTVNEFEYSYFTGVDEALLDGLQQNQEFFSLLLNDEALKKEVLGIFIKSIYDDLKRDNT